MGRGRPSKLTPELQERILQLIRKGNYIEVACAAVGIDKSTYYKWLQRGQQAKSGKYFDFFIAAKKAEREAETAFLDRIREAAFKDKDWKAAAWYLERKYPERWGRKERHEVTGEDGGEITLKIIWGGADGEDD